MKPKTKIQKAAWDAFRYLPQLTQKQTDYAVQKFFPKYCYATKNKAFCLECGEDVPVANIHRKRLVCKSCNSKLKVEETRKTTFSDGPYYLAVTCLVQRDGFDFQVSRVFEFRRHYRRGSKANLYAQEICQNWYTEDGQRVVIARLINGYNAAFSGGDMEVRGFSFYKTYDPIPDIYCPSSVFRPEYAKKGISWKMTNLSLSDAITAVRIPYNETLLKSGYNNVLSGWNDYMIREYWSTLKICIRNKYKIKDVKIYKDLLDALKYLGKDLRNAHYVCPKDLHKAHDYYLLKKNEKEVGKTIAVNMKRALKDNPQYVQEKRKFLDLQFGNKSIKVRLLQNVVEFLKEGAELKHCVYTGSYHKIKESLVLSARVKNKPVETIEISLEDFKIKQAYGFRNRPSKYHKDILKLVSQNIPRIKEIANQR